MNTDLQKRLEEAADRFAYKKWLNTAYPLRKVDCKIDFKAGAEYGYKEAIAQAKQWIENQWKLYYEAGKLNKILADFEADMKKLWEGEK